jgi:hypothetical protein
MSAGARRALGADELYNEQHDSESQRPRLATGLRLRAPGGLVPCMKPNRTQSGQVRSGLLLGRSLGPLHWHEGQAKKTFES